MRWELLCQARFRRILVFGTKRCTGGSFLLSAKIPSGKISRTAAARLLLTGEDIRRHLSGCSDCVLLCATLGSEVDALIRRTQVTDMAKTLWLDAAASAAIEQVCDEVQLDIAQRLERSLTTRFSCGYGDLPLSAQPHFLSCLDAGRKIGLHLSPSGMLVPIKSVTAVIGILPEGAAASHSDSCSICNLRENCQLRRKGVFCGKDHQ